MSAKRWAVAVVAYLVLTGGFAKANTVVFSNFDTPGNLGVTVIGAPMTPPAIPGSPGSAGMPFTPDADSTITQVEVWVGPLALTAPNDEFDLSLFSDNSGVPGASIATVAIGLDPGSFVPITGVAATGLSIPVTAGDTYWLVMTPFNAESGLAWFDSSTPGPIAFRTNSTDGTGPWFTTNLSMSMGIIGPPTPASPVPEPETISLMALGLAALILLLAAKRGTDRSEIRC